MKTTITAPLLLTFTLAMSMTACARSPQPAVASGADAQAASVAAVADEASAVTGSASSASSNLPLLVVNRSPTCGCCGVWVDHMREAGFEVQVNNIDNVNPIKERVGVPMGKGSCHTAEVGGYFVEGHVPAEDVKRLLAEKPDAKGLVLPGMPLGSPGMEVPDGTVQPYTVELVGRDGSTSAFAEHGPGHAGH
ncbi:MAG: DUF411 domain-containing protein [Pseudomonadota bacterium]|nr:DUF411 domain-containing protein [Pseudomonadota bacterium]